MSRPASAWRLVRLVAIGSSWTTYTVGYPQGGYLTVFIDELLATAITSVLEDGEWAMTAEFKINFLRALTHAPLEGSGRVLRRSRGLVFLEAQVATEGGQIAVTPSSTRAVMKR